MRNDLIASFSIYRLLLRRKFQYIRITDCILIAAGFAALSYFMNMLLLRGLSGNYGFLTGLLLLFTCVFLGVLAIAGACNRQEMQYLKLTSVRISIPVLLMLYRVLTPLLILHLLLLATLLWGGLKPFSAVLYLKLNGGFLSGLLLFYIVQRLSQRITGRPVQWSNPLASLLSSYPALKKELKFMFSLQRAVPLILVLAVCQLAIFLLKDYPLALLVTVMLTVIFMHDAWTVNLLGLEEEAIKMYLFNQLDVQQLLFKKWATGLILSWIISIANYAVWGLFIRPSAALLLSYLFKITLFNLALSMICSLVGLYFSDFQKRGYYRISLSGILIFAPSAGVLFYIALSSSFALLLTALCISYFFLRTFKDTNTLRGALYD
jgi:hypothetical protein